MLSRQCRKSVWPAKYRARSQNHSWPGYAARPYRIEGAIPRNASGRAAWLRLVKGQEEEEVSLVEIKITVVEAVKSTDNIGPH
jgi:hypothetical protein